MKSLPSIITILQHQDVRSLIDILIIHSFIYLFIHSFSEPFNHHFSSNHHYFQFAYGLGRVFIGKLCRIILFISPVFMKSFSVRHFNRELIDNLKIDIEASEFPVMRNIRTSGAYTLQTDPADGGRATCTHRVEKSGGKLMDILDYAEIFQLFKDWELAGFAKWELRVGG